MSRNLVLGIDAHLEIRSVRIGAQFVVGAPGFDFLSQDYTFSGSLESPPFLIRPLRSPVAAGRLSQSDQEAILEFLSSP